MSTQSSTPPPAPRSAATEVVVSASSSIIIPEQHITLNWNVSNMKRYLSFEGPRDFQQEDPPSSTIARLPFQIVSTPHKNGLYFRVILRFKQ